MSDATINLKCYTIQIREKRKKDVFLDINKVVFGEKDFFEIAGDFIKHLETVPYKNSSETIKMYFDDKPSLDKTNRILSGRLKKGNSGKESDVVDIDDDTNKVLFKVGRRHANINPFYFMIALPKNKRFGVLIVQSFKYFGLKEALEDSLKKFFMKNYENYVCEIFPLVNTKLFDKMLTEGAIRKLILTQHKLPSDIEQQLDKNAITSNVEVEVVLKAKGRNSVLGLNKKIKSFKDKNTSFLELIKIKGFHADEVSAEVVHGRNQRKIKMDDPTDLGSFYDITNDVETDDTGHPVFKSIDKIAKDIYKNDILSLR